MQKIKAVIFDMDGTLANTLPLCIEAFRQAVEPLLHRSVTDEEIESHLGPNEAGAIKAIAPDSDYNKAAIDFVQHYEALHHMCPHPFDGIVPLLQILKDKGVHLAIASGKGEEATALSLRRFKMVSFFPIVKNGTPEGGQKPGDMAAIIQLFGDVTKEETIYVGDSASDIKDSHKANVTAIAAAWAPTAKAAELQKEEPAEIFYTVQDFADWLTSRI